MPWNWMPLRRSLVRLFRAFYDIIAVAFAYLLFVVWVLNGFDWEGALFVIGVATFAAAPARAIAGVHRHVWRYVSVRDAASLTDAALMVAAGGHLRDANVVNAYLPRLLASQRYRRLGIMPALRTHVSDPELLRQLSSGILQAGVPIDRLVEPFQ